MKITQRLSTAFYPETNGATEKANQELETYLRIFTSFQQEDWAFQLPIAMMALNSRVSQFTGLSPFFMTHGYHQSNMDFTVPEQQGSSFHLQNKDVNWLSVGKIVLIWQRQPWPLHKRLKSVTPIHDV